MIQPFPEPTMQQLETAAVRELEYARSCLLRARQFMARAGYRSLAVCCEMQAEDCEEDIRVLVDITLGPEALQA